MTGIAKQVEDKLRERPEVQDTFSVHRLQLRRQRRQPRGHLREPDAHLGARGRRSTPRRRWSPSCSGALLGACRARSSSRSCRRRSRGRGRRAASRSSSSTRAARADFTELARATRGSSVAEATKRRPRRRAVLDLQRRRSAARRDDRSREGEERRASPITQISDALGVYLGSQYVNDFDFDNRSYRVYVQAAAPFRGQPRDIGQFYVRSRAGGLTALDSLVT